MHSNVGVKSPHFEVKLTWPLEGDVSVSLVCAELNRIGSPPMTKARSASASSQMQSSIKILCAYDLMTSRMGHRHRAEVSFGLETGSDLIPSLISQTGFDRLKELI